ncbi:AAA family ATPase [Radiobacillus kanasensis]|uniref:ATP-binding protein n=1 Tax=Radiobacillus kanasensis TaxID=2844358 RepID=UPI001E53D40D|nr:AAA family ATPase [Radiobacillus kanasensis]UFU00475.1 AAA family ATPase [Radiobacillus kanasensis]
MKIKSAFIYGFGKWEQQEIDFSPHSFSIVIGENESGKSTLRHFLLFMLFGLPPKRREFYRPATGGTIGGKLTVSTESDGEIVLERDHHRLNGELQCYLENGERKNEEWFRTRLTGLSLETYQSIFSFNAQELYQLHTLKEEDLGEVLLGVGMTGSDQIYTTEKRLEQYASELFKPQGRNPKINRQVERLEEVSNEIVSIQNEQEKYIQAKEEQQRLQEKLQRLQKEQIEAQERQAYISKKLEIHPQMVDYHVTATELERLRQEGVNHFPTNGVERYQQLKEKLLPIQSEIRVLHSTIETLKYDIAELKSGQFPRERLERLNQLLQQVNRIQQISMNLDFKEKESNQLLEELKQILQRINAGLATEDLDDMSIPFHIEEYWNQLKQEKEHFIHSENQLAEEQSVLHRQSREVENNLGQLQQKLLPNQKVQELEAILNRHHLPQETSRTSSNWNKEQKKRIKKSNQHLITGWLVAIILGAIGYFLEISILVPISISIAILSIGQAFFVRQSLKEWTPAYQAEALSPEQAEEYANAKRQLDDHAHQLDQYRKLEVTLSQMQTAQLKIEEKQQFHQQSGQQLQQKIDWQIETYPFLRKIELSYWPRLYAYLETAQEKRKQWKQVEHELESLRHSYSDFERNALDYLWGEEGIEKEVDLEEIIVLLRQERKSQQQISEQLDYVSQQLQTKETLLSDHVERAVPYQEEMNQLLDTTGTEREDYFLERGALFEKWGRKQQQMEQLKHSLSIGLDKGELDILMTEPPVEQEKLEAEVTHIGRMIQGNTDDLEETRQALANLNSRLSMLESSEQYSQYLHDYYLEKEVLQQQVKQWAIYKMAQTALQTAKQNYLHNYMPTIMEATTSLLEQLTDGRYKRVFAPSGGNRLEVESAGGQRFHVDQLSQGTSDQLYIALRLALGTVMSEQYGLPFIIDDAFVHFDEKRTDRMMDILENLSTSHQILLFSCRPQLIDISKNAHVIPLSSNLVENRSHS